MAKELKAEDQGKAPGIPKQTAVSLIGMVANRFIKSADQVIAGFPYEHRLELIEHFESMLSYMEKYSKSGDEEEQSRIGLEYMEKEHLLLRKYGRLLREYDAKRFNRYFDIDEAIIDFEVIPMEMYQEILEENKEEKLGRKGMRSFLWMVRNGIGSHKRYYLLNKEPEVPVSVQVGSIDADVKEAEQERTDKEAYRARAVLALHFLLQARGIGRKSHHVAAVSRFVHMLFGIEDVANDKIYKMLRVMPNYNTDQTLQDDLKYIRPFFEELNMDDVLKLIDQEAVRASKGRRQRNKAD